MGVVGVTFGVYIVWERVVWYGNVWHGMGSLLLNFSQKFLMHILRSPSLFDLVVPLLYQLLETRTNPGVCPCGVSYGILRGGDDPCMLRSIYR